MIWVETMITHDAFVSPFAPHLAHNLNGFLFFLASHNYGTSDKM